MESQGVLLPHEVTYGRNFVMIWLPRPRVFVAGPGPGAFDILTALQSLLSLVFLQHLISVWSVSYKTESEAQTWGALRMT